MSGVSPEPLHVYVYGSGKREETFIYLREKDAFDDLPAPLRESLGELRYVVDFRLSAERALARVDSIEVLKSLHDRGFYLQLAPHPATDKDLLN